MIDRLKLKLAEVFEGFIPQDGMYLVLEGGGTYVKSSDDGDFKQEDYIQFLVGDADPQILDISC